MKKIALVGDIGFFGKYSKELNHNVEQQFAEMADYLASFDYVIGNLEVPFVQGIKPLGSKSAHVSSSPENIALLKFLNFTHVSLANNHLYDFGQEGMDMTVALLEKAGIDYFGIRDKSALIEEANVALHGYCCFSTNPYGLNQGVNSLNVPNVKQKMQAFDQQGYLNIVSVHAGLEHVNLPAYHDIQLARQLSDTANYVYYGHHPHVLQGIEQHNDSLLAYSLGNFCFDDVYTAKSDKPLIAQSDNNKTSAILILHVDQGQVMKYETQGFYAAEDRLVLGVSDLDTKLAQYHAYLQQPESEYSAYRQSLLTAYVAKRKDMRDFNWYVKRLNFHSAVMIMRAKYNARQHYKNVLTHLDDTQY
jgi:poly-gamma-glutamate synthesis protein (capsule biosynthesis protein)